MVGETDVIVRYLQQQQGPEHDLENPADLRDAEAQSAAADTRSWALGAVRSGDVNAMKAYLTWAVEKYRRLDAFVPDDQPYFGGDSPSFADFHSMEAVFDLMHVCGKQAELFLEELPKLHGLYERVTVRPGIIAHWSSCWKVE